MEDKYIILDGLKWRIPARLSGVAYPLCPKDLLRLDNDILADFSSTLVCPDCGRSFPLPRQLDMEKKYVVNKVNAKFLKNVKFINLDDESLPIAEDKIKSENSKYFVTSRLMKSKTGLRLVVYAGEKGNDKKTQIFVEPDIKRLAFDQKDLHPTDVFAKLEATFADGTKHEIKK